MRTSLNVSIRDLPAEQIQLEITESALMADPARVLATMARISALVWRSRSTTSAPATRPCNLRRLPLTEVKVDRSFVAGMAHNADDAAIVRSTVELAGALGPRSYNVPISVPESHERLSQLAWHDAGSDSRVMTLIRQETAPCPA